MLKKLYKKTISHKLLFSFLIAVGIIIFAVLIMLTPIGNSIFKKVIESKIERYIPGAEVTYLDYGVNNFSFAAKKGHNILKVYGVMIPLNAMFEGSVEKLSEISPDYRGKINLSGKLYIDHDKYVAEGISFFANGYMNFIVKLNEGVSVSAKGSDFDVQKLLYMFEVNYPWVNGKTDFRINKKDGSLVKVQFKTTGEYSNKVKTAFKAVTKIDMHSKKDLKFTSDVSADLGDMKIKGEVKGDEWGYTFEAERIDLAKLQPKTLYPFKGYVDLTGKYHSANDVIKFKGNGFEGFSDSRLEVNFKLDSKRFFDYAGVIPLLNGDVSGTIKINDKFGTFDIVSNNTHFKENKITQRIKYLTGIDLSKENTGKVFFKGHFDGKELVFDMLSTNQTISISVKKGKVVYPDKYDIVMYLRKNNNVFKLHIGNDGIKVLEKRDFRDRDNKILVF